MIRSLDRYFLDAARLWAGEASWSEPLALVDLDKAQESVEGIVLPSCPVIGIGDSANPLASLLDGVVEPPVTLDGLARQILASPRAAAVTVQLLRLLPGLSGAAGLDAESLAYAVLQGSAEHADWLAAGGNAAERSPVEGRVALALNGDGLTITLDRAESGNAIDRPMRDALYDAFALAALDPAITRVSLRANGKAFSLGAELSEFGTTRDPATAHAIRGQTLPARMAQRVAGKLDAHVDGACVGAGLELAAWASRLTASPRAWFQLPELAMGILPGAGGCVSLTRRVGRQRAALLILSGRRLSATQALDWGLVDAIVDEPA